MWQLFFAEPSRRDKSSLAVAAECDVLCSLKKLKRKEIAKQSGIRCQLKQKPTVLEQVTVRKVTA